MSTICSPRSRVLTNGFSCREQIEQIEQGASHHTLHMRN
jgi:hypothetical protein